MGLSVLGNSARVLQKEKMVMTTPKVAPVAQMAMAMPMTIKRLQ